MRGGITFDVAHMLAGSLVLLSFMQLWSVLGCISSLRRAMPTCCS